jgi:KaiC/GvpD/RAD55 family RecA-like ATPase
MNVSILDSADKGKVKQKVEGAGFEDIAEICLKYNWAPGTFKERRRLEDFEQTEILAFDIDDGLSLSDAVARASAANLKYIIATTKSHQKIKHEGQPNEMPACDRFRVILFLDEAITDVKDYENTWTYHAMDWPEADYSCKDASRFFYKCLDIVSMNEVGETLAVKLCEKKDAAKPLIKAPEGERGELWKSTLDFLLNGAPAGSRHHALVKAVGNMKDQGYEQEEVTARVEAMTFLPTASWSQPGLNPKDLSTIKDIFTRPPKYEFKEQGAAEPLVTDTFISAGELLDESFEYLSDKDKVKGEPTGIEGLDRLLGGGFRTGELTVLMAQAKTGKNTFYHYLIYSYLKRGVPFGYASRELSPATEVLPNFLSIDFGTNIWKANITDGFKKAAREALANWPLYFAPGYGYFDPKEMRKWFEEMKSIGVNHFLFDHLHYSLMSEDYESTTKLIKELKTITKELDIHLNLIVQPRSLRDGERLSLATLRGGAAIGQALDNLLILERVRGQDNISKLSLEVARHKLCRLGDIYLKYDAESTRFEEVEKVLVEPEPHDPRESYGSKSWHGYRVDQ